MIFHEKSKYTDIKFHYIYELVKTKKLCLSFFLLNSSCKYCYKANQGINIAPFEENDEYNEDDVREAL